MNECNVLVVDDDEAVRLVTAEMLTRLGYCVTAVESGASALQVLAEEEFQVVLLDMAMPVMSGIDVYRAMRQAEFSGRVIFMTGYGYEELAGVCAEDAQVAVLTKPFPIQELKDSIDSALVKARV